MAHPVLIIVTLHTDMPQAIIIPLYLRRHVYNRVLERRIK